MIGILTAVALGFATVIGSRVLIRALNDRQPFLPQASERDYTPPSHALRATVYDIDGTIRILRRGESEFRPFTGDAVLQGETLSAADGSSYRVRIPYVAEIFIADSAEVGFPSLTPPNLLMTQESGSVRYSLSGDNKLAIRIRNALVTLIGSACGITVDGSDVRVDVERGVVVTAYVDSANDTQVYRSDTGSAFRYRSDERRIVEIR